MLQRLAEALLSRTSYCQDVRGYGGFLFGRLSDGTVVPHVNSWITAFAVQSLRGYREYLDRGRFEVQPFDLV